jgi:carboxyl-terminal processing protease
MPDAYTHAKEIARLFIDYYYDAVNLGNVEDVTDALLKCYVSTLDDPYSAYRPYVEAEIHEEEMSGKTIGIGITIVRDYTTETIQISEVQPNSPAEMAGIMTGDYMIAVDGVSIQEIGLKNVGYRIKGEVGTSVNLTLLRGEEEITVTVTREEIEEINAYYRYDEESGMGYIRIVSFEDNTFEQFKD